ncbi:MAG TPA: hypothetical protein VME42_01950 [Steroidobacteraceae bacterium]|nr:hypothetical protein [Steroidobacteraceae bacterium]
MTESMSRRPQVGYWHLWTDAEGITHQTRCQLTSFEVARIGAAAPQWNNRQPTLPCTVVFTEQPVGWVGDWHENPAPQWIIVLSGRWWIESMDGTRIEQGPGEFSLGEDQGSILMQGRKGHRSGTIGSEPARLMTVQLHTAPTRAPCHVR